MLLCTFRPLAALPYWKMIVESFPFTVQPSSISQEKQRACVNLCPQSFVDEFLIEPLTETSPCHFFILINLPDGSFALKSERIKGYSEDEQTP